MSKVKLTGHVSGTGVLTVTSPDTDTDRTITLPDATGTLATTDDTTDLDGAVVINESGADVDFRVESDDNANMLFVDGGEDAVLIGHNASDGKGASLQIHGTGGHALEISRWADSANGVNLTLTKSRGASVGTEGIVSDGDTAGQIAWNVDDGTDQASQIATIKAAVDGTPGANDTPGRLVFSTTADGSDSTTERLRITEDGRGLSQFTAKVWCNWGSSTINDSHNVSGVDDDGTGLDTVNFTNALSNNNYSCTTSGAGRQTNDTDHLWRGLMEKTSRGGRTTSQITFGCAYSDATLQDTISASMVIFGD